MKKYLLFIMLIRCYALAAQTPEDALRYSFYSQNGSARNRAIGGAMGSLGGDITATFVNPAGLGFYKTQEFVLSPEFLMNNNKNNFRETINKNTKNSFAFGPSGWVWGWANRYNPKNSNAVSLAVTQTANFSNSIQYRGLNNYSSFSEQFAEEFAKSGYSIFDVLNTNSPLPYGAAPALYTFLIDTITVNGVQQIKAAPQYILDAQQALKQEMTRTTSGGISEFAFAYAHNTNDKFFWGITLGIPIINYTSNTKFTESDTSNNTSNHFNNFTYTDDFTTKGIGANLKLGIIYKPREYIRLGLALHTPTFMGLKDTRTTSISAALENPVSNLSVASTTFTNGQPGESKYFQTTPFKAILSASFVFKEINDTKKQKAFITADIEYVNYKASKFSSNNTDATASEKTYYTQLNDVIKYQNKANFNFKIGGELKFNIIMARLGFAYYGNPYSNALEYTAPKTLLSGGLGYRNKGIFIDLTYVYDMSKNVDFPG